jgi:uncharacterized protein (UPF0297 family)
MSNLPHVFDLLYDLKTVEQLHDHLTGRQRYAVSSTDAEIIETCVDHKIDLPDNMLAPQVTLKSLTRTIDGLATLVDLAVVQQSLEKAHEAFFKQKIQPLFDRCKSKEEAKEVFSNVYAMLENKGGEPIEMPAAIEFFLRKELSKISRKIDYEERSKDHDGGPSI